MEYEHVVIKSFNDDYFQKTIANRFFMNLIYKTELEQNKIVEFNFSHDNRQDEHIIEDQFEALG